MKTFEEIKNGLFLCKRNHCSKTCPYHGMTGCYVTMHDDALAYIQQMEVALPRWISVEDRLPEDYVHVLIYAIDKVCKDWQIARTFYTHKMHGSQIGGWVQPWQCFNTRFQITHWMPLPQPPKEEGNETS